MVPVFYCSFGCFVVSVSDAVVLRDDVRDVVVRDWSTMRLVEDGDAQWLLLLLLLLLRNYCSSCHHPSAAYYSYYYYCVVVAAVVVVALLLLVP